MSKAIRDITIFSILFDWTFKNCTDEQIKNIIKGLLSKPNTRKPFLNFIMFSSYLEDVEKLDEEIRKAIEDDRLFKESPPKEED